MSRSASAVEFGLLGAVEMRAAGRLLPAGRRQQRHVLAVLAAEAGRPVSAETLIDRVWDQAPDGARQTLHVYITGLRRLLAQATTADTAVLVRRSGGYLLDIDPDQVDLHRFRELRDRAGQPDRPDEQRAALLRQALDLWRGQPLTGLAGAWVVRVRQAWRQECLDATLAWADTQLRLGNPGAVIGPLIELAGEHPFAESLTGVLMRALYAAGRAADALDRYQQARRHLAEELGIDPGADLQRLHRAILRGDPTAPPAAPAPAARAGASVLAGPAQLPADVTGFAGRSDHLARLDQLLAESAEQPTAVVISAIDGTAGVGKTALAVHWAHRVSDRFPDGQLYINLRGFDPVRPPTPPGEAIRGFLDALHVPPRQIPAGLDTQAALYRSLLAGKALLVVLDNARDAEQVRPLLPGASGCLVVVTSRNQLTGLIATDGAHPMTLDLLSDVEARALLHHRLGAARVAAEPDAVERIIAACARLPLALAVAAARVAIRPRLPLTALACELDSSRTRLDAFGGDDAATNVRAVFSWSYGTLGAGAARLFRLLGLHAGPDCDTAAAASLAGEPVDRVRPLLAELAHAHLVAERGVGRYGFHDLLRAYAVEEGERAGVTDAGPARRLALHRMLDHYLHTANAAARLLDPQRDPIELAPRRPAVTVPQLTTAAEALAWFAAEYPVLLATVDVAARAGFDGHAWRLAWTMADYFDRQGRWQDWRAVHTAALAAAERSGDRAGQAHSHRDLARSYGKVGEHDNAHAHLLRALKLFGALRDRTGEASTRLNLGGLLGRQGRYTEALAQARQALRLFREINQRNGQARALNNAGWYEAKLGHHQQALLLCRQALELMEALGDRRATADTWDSLGLIHNKLGHHDKAGTCYRRALDIFREIGDRLAQAESLTGLGDTLHAAGNLPTAHTAWRDALAILDDLAHPDAAQVRARLPEPDSRDVGEPAATGKA